MNRAELTEHDVSPEMVIAAIRSYDGPILLDLDETLYLRNSTEDFIDSARPRLLALILMCFLDLVKPWRWTGGEEQETSGAFARCRYSFRGSDVVGGAQSTRLPLNSPTSG
jgi:hypothetical protein